MSATRRARASYRGSRPVREGARQPGPRGVVDADRAGARQPRVLPVPVRRVRAQRLQERHPPANAVVGADRRLGVRHRDGHVHATGSRLRQQAARVPGRDERPGVAPRQATGSCVGRLALAGLERAPAAPADKIVSRLYPPGVPFGERRPCGTVQGNAPTSDPPTRRVDRCGQMTLSRSSTTMVPITETMIEPMHPRPLEKKTNTAPRYPVPAHPYARRKTSTRSAPALSR